MSAKVLGQIFEWTKVQMGARLFVDCRFSPISVVESTIIFLDFLWIVDFFWSENVVDCRLRPSKSCRFVDQ